MLMLQRWPVTIGSVLLALSLAGCWTNNYPTANNFIRPAIADCARGQLENCLSDGIVHVFADANGTLYPSGWRSGDGFARLGRAKSLLNATTAGSDARALIEREERRQLEDIAALGQGNGRIFILVHGYNNNVAEADMAYRMVERRLNTRPEDRIIRFYWDGLTSGNVIGGGRIWFHAAGNSQLVGSRALRNILRQFQGKHIYLIGHSRGTSVILSALGNPVYDPDFLSATLDLARSWGMNAQAAELFMHPPALENRDNLIHVLVLAPSVDRIDFCEAAAQPEASSSFYCDAARLRPLGEQVVSFRYSVNRGDPVLNKFIGLGGRFNPTRLGLLEEVGQLLCRERYSIMRPYVIDPPAREHEFTWYAAQPQFARMLDHERISREPSAPPDEGPAETDRCEA